MIQRPAVSKLLVAALSLTSAWVALAADKPPVNLDLELAPIIIRAKIPGMAALVLRGDRIIAQGVAGVRKKGTAEPITLDDQFELCSAAKSMTATLAAMLVDEGKLQWNTTLPELFTDTVGLDPAWRKVTLRQLLVQRSGITGFHLMAFSSSIRSAPEDIPRQRREFSNKLLKHEPDIPPGSKFAYSSPNYIVASSALEKITGQSWEELMRSRLFSPLGITGAGFGPPGTSGHVDQPWGHGSRSLNVLPIPVPGFGISPFDPGSPTADCPLALAPAGLVHMPIKEWAKFVSMHLRGDPANPYRQVTLLKAETFSRLHQLESGESDYAVGWFVGMRPWAKGSRPDDTGRVLFHEGNNFRWTSVVWLAPELDFAVLIVCNRGGMQKAVDEVASALIRFATPLKNSN